MLFSLPLVLLAVVLVVVVEVVVWLVWLLGLAWSGVLLLGLLFALGLVL
jgi:hypothetical protein